MQKKIDSEIRLNTMKAIEAAANAKFTEENIKTIDGQLQLWGKQVENWEGAYRDWETDRKSTRLNSSHSAKSRMPSSA